MKIPPHRKNARFAAAGLTPPATAPVCHGNLDTIDPEQFVLETLTALKQLPPEKLTADLRQQVADWVPPRFKCPGCLRGGLLSETIRDQKKQCWRCPACHKPVTSDPVS